MKACRYCGLPVGWMEIERVERPHGRTFEHAIVAEACVAGHRWLEIDGLEAFGDGVDWLASERLGPDVSIAWDVLLESARHAPSPPARLAS